MSTGLEILIYTYFVVNGAAVALLLKRVSRLEESENTKKKREHERKSEQKKIGERILSEMKCLNATNTALVTEVKNITYKGNADKMSEQEFQRAIRISEKACDDNE